MSHSWLLAESLALTLCLVGTAARAQCTKDLDCRGELICENGECVQAVPPPPPAVESPTASPAATPTAASAPTAPPQARRVEPPRVIAVESPPVTEKPGLERRSPTLIVVGSLAVLGGVAGLVVGLGSMGSTCHRELGDGFRVDHCETSPDYLAYGLGTGALVGGAVLIAIGAQKVAAEPTAQLAPWIKSGAGGLSLRLKL